MQLCTSLQTDNHASTPPLSFLQAGCPSCRPTNSVKALKARQGAVCHTRTHFSYRYSVYNLPLYNNYNFQLCLPVVANEAAITF